MVNETKSPMINSACRLGQRDENTDLLKQMASDYSKYLQNTSLFDEVCKIEEYVQESIAKLHELQNLFEMKENERWAWSSQVLPEIVTTANLLTITLGQRLETLACLIKNMHSTLDTLETHINMLESKIPNMLGVNGAAAASSIRSVIKYFMKLDPSQSEAVTETPVNLTMSINVSSDQLHNPDPLQLTNFFHST